MLRALAVAPNDRYPTAEAMRREIEALGHRLDLVLGDAAVSEVMTQLFDDRREPWRRATSRAETDVARVPEIIAPDDNDVTSPTVVAEQQQRRGPLRTATQAVDALIQELDTPARGTLLESAKKAAAAVPVPINQADTGAVTMIAGLASASLASAFSFGEGSGAGFEAAGREAAGEASGSSTMTQVCPA